MGTSQSTVQSSGVQFCSGGQLYTTRSQMMSNKLDQESRVGYASTKPIFQVQRLQKAHQQIVPQQQLQEEITEIKLSGPGRWQIPKSFFDSDIGFEDTFELADEVHEEIPDWLPEVLDSFKENVKVFEALYGNAIINVQNGLVAYTDISGRRHCEEFDRENIEKIFPMGIAQGGLTKSIWFKDAIARDDFFDLMITVPPCYDSVISNPAKFRRTELADDTENIKVFDGINDRNVIVHSENIVLYTALDGDKHCIHYDKHTIEKCFPNGIRSGGLPRTIWFNDELERDLCFMLMQWNMDEEVQAQIIPDSPSQFKGLYGGVVLHLDSQIEYTSMIGDRVKCFYEPSEIRGVFPKGISYGRLPKTIWFQNEKERNDCITAMRKM